MNQNYIKNILRLRREYNRLYRIKYFNKIPYHNLRKINNDKKFIGYSTPQNTFVV